MTLGVVCIPDYGSFLQSAAANIKDEVLKAATSIEGESVF
jgi:hypothetical protein